MAEAVQAIGPIILLVSSLAFQSPILETRSIAPHAAGEPTAANIRIDVSLVMIPVRVTTLDGTNLPDLPKEDFRLFEEGVEQKVSYFAKDDAPISIGVLLDTSGSMHNKMRRCSQAANTFFHTANPLDEFFLIEFSERPKLTVPFTSDIDDLYQHFSHAHPFGRTSLLDAIHLASLQMKHARYPRKAILIFSDGGDNRSRFSLRQIKSDVLESDMQAYSIGIFDPAEMRKITPEEENGPALLTELADSTGGRHYPVEKLDELTSIASRISNELRTEYLVGYLPSNTERDGKYRHVKVQVNAKDQAKLDTYYRRGYYAPVQ